MSPLNGNELILSLATNYKYTNYKYTSARQT